MYCTVQRFVRNEHPVVTLLSCRVGHQAGRRHQEGLSLLRPKG